MNTLILRDAFLSSSYGQVTQRAYLSNEMQLFCPHWATSKGYAIVTAWNPQGQQSSAQDNAKAQARLLDDLATYAVQAGYNGERQWREETFIVINMSLKQARKLGQKYGQAAVIWGTGARAALVWCECGRIERFWWSATPMPKL